MQTKPILEPQDVTPQLLEALVKRANESAAFYEMQARLSKNPETADRWRLHAMAQHQISAVLMYHPQSHTKK